MTVDSICNHNAATIDSDADVARAADLMRKEHVGDLIVTAQRNGHTVPVGVITDRDIVVGIVAKNIPPSQVKVGDTLRGKLVTVRESDAVGFALREMRRAGVRRLPVIDGEDRLVGVLSIDDAIDHLAKQLGEIADTIRIQQDSELSRRP
jgi:CBS domain-containing protein